MPTFKINFEGESDDAIDFEAVAYRVGRRPHREVKPDGKWYRATLDQVEASDEADAERKLRTTFEEAARRAGTTVNLKNIEVAPDPAGDE
jgi:hypothetical protein